jgi:hypothetical protein
MIYIQQSHIYGFAALHGMLLHGDCPSGPVQHGLLQESALAAGWGGGC